MDKPTSVASMLFAVTPKDQTVAIANKDSLEMDLIAQVRKQKHCMLRICCTSMTDAFTLFIEGI